MAINGSGPPRAGSARPATVLKTRAQDAAPKGEPPESHVVVKGDTLSGIAKRFGIPFDDIKAWNPDLERGKSFNDLRIGDTVHLRAPAAPEAADPAEKTTPGGKDHFVGGMLGGVLANKAKVRAETEARVKELPPAIQGRLEEAKAKDPMKASIATTVAASASFGRLPEAQQQRALDLVLTGTVDEQFKLMSLAQGQLKVSGESTVGARAGLDSQAPDGSYLVDHLHALKNGPVASEITKSGIDRQQVYRDVLAQTAEPESRIFQSNRGTCTVTSLEYQLARSSPAEYARIMRGLASPSGEVKTRGGATLKRDPGSEKPDSAVDRSTASRLFQSALMEHANGDLLDYRNDIDKHTRRADIGFFGWAKARLGTAYGDNLGRELSEGLLAGDKETRAKLAGMRRVENAAGQADSKGSGLYDNQVSRAAEALFGSSGTTLRMARGGELGKRDASALLQQLDKLHGKKASLAFDWGDSGHQVAFERIEGGRLYFRNQWTNDGDPKSNPPGAKVENPFESLWSVPLETARTHLKSVVTFRPPTAPAAPVNMDFIGA